VGDDIQANEPEVRADVFGRGRRVADAAAAAS
jgi:hypothetical protein